MYDVSYLSRGKIKSKIIKQLEKPKTATQLAQKNKKHRSAMSKILLDLEKHGFAVCLNPKDVMTRYYQITDRGRQALKMLKDFE